MSGGAGLGQADLDGVGGLVAEAGRLALRWFRADPAALGVADKGGRTGFDPVTEADRAVEGLIRAGLAERFPGDAVLGEEQGLTGDPDAPRRWMVDPIDGTKAFVSGVPAWGILLGLLDGGRPVAGWLHQPYLGETFAAAGGRGTFTGRDGAASPLRARGTTRMADAVMYTTHPNMFATEEERAAFGRIAGAVRLQRFGGDCYSYGLLALGQVDLVVEADLHPYDIVPLIPIIEAAGGTVTDRAGRTPVEGGFVVAAATPELHAAALALVNGRS
ncbi:inositol monophosphatase family protein [Actinomadura parmotrematis]|uniref:Histidinol phosphatase n=1 Tax=Actinomadura parmotrematis TaxID=2864039 RepID=A0ABS7FZI8_9ACTN|nr:inositol monophosphatase family protein [Actinomadura parmotrematis]MBW8485716.1 histidinol phosphatase [Actinomadura parmotrematis]